MTKLTNVSVLNAIRALIETTSTPVMDDFTNEEVLAKVDAIILSFKKKSAHTTHKKTAVQEQNETLRGQIVEILSDGILRSTADLRIALGLPEDTTPQKITGIIRPAVESGVISSKTVKGKKFYFLADGVEE